MDGATGKRWHYQLFSCVYVLFVQQINAIRPRYLINPVYVCVVQILSEFDEILKILKLIKLINPIRIGLPEICFFSKLFYNGLVPRARHGPLQNFRSRRWGSSLPGLRMLDPPLGPPWTWAEFFRRMCLQSHLQTPTQPIRSHIQSFGTLGQLFPNIFG